MAQLIVPFQPVKTHAVTQIIVAVMRIELYAARHTTALPFLPGLHNFVRRRSFEPDRLRRCVGRFKIHRLDVNAFFQPPRVRAKKLGNGSPAPARQLRARDASPGRSNTQRLRSAPTLQAFDGQAYTQPVAFRRESQVAAQ